VRNRSNSGPTRAVLDEAPPTRDQRIKRAIERHYRLKELETLTGIRIATWRKKVLLRQISYTKCGGSVLVSESEIRRLLQEGAVPARGRSEPS
jgi:hypothetical protein